MLQLFRFARGREPRFPEIGVKPRANSAARQQFCGFGGISGRQNRGRAGTLGSAVPIIFANIGLCLNYRHNLVATPLADEAFRRRGGHKLSGAGEERAAAKGAAATRAWAVLSIKQPIIDPETSMEPDGMVEACQHQRRVEDEAAMRDERRIEQGEVGGIGQDALVEREVVAELASRFDPHLLRGGPLLRAEIAGEVDQPDLDRSLSLPIAPDSWWQAVDQKFLQVGLARQGFRLRHLRHLHLMREAFLDLMEGSAHGEDRLAMLDRNHAAGGKAAAIADAVDIVDDRHRRIPGPEEIGVERMSVTVLDGATGGDQRLADHLAAEDTLPAHLRAHAAKQVLLERLDVEDRKKLVESAAHEAPFISFAQEAERGRSTKSRVPNSRHRTYESLWARAAIAT